MQVPFEDSQKQALLDAENICMLNATQISVDHYSMGRRCRQSRVIRLRSAVLLLMPLFPYEHDMECESQAPRLHPLPPALQ